jgi:drug/metabolite transporter (DMT)-like permease
VDRRRVFGLALIVVSAAGFSSGTVLAKPIFGLGLDWLQLLSWRFTLAAALAWAWILASPRRRSGVRRLGRRPALIAIGLGVWYTGNTGTYYAGLETVPASLAGVLVYLYPAIVAALSVRYATRLSGRRPWVALAITLVGVVLTLGGIDLATPPPVGGIALILVTPLIYAGWIVMSARLAGERADHLAPVSAEAGEVDDAAAASALMISATAVVLVVGAVVTGRHVLPGDIPAAAWPYLIGMAFAGTFLAIQAFYAGSRRIGAAQAALVSTVEPLIIVVVAAVALNEHLAPVQLAGAGLILLGVLVAQTAERPIGTPQPARPLDAEAAFRS